MNAARIAFKHPTAHRKPKTLEENCICLEFASEFAQFRGLFLSVSVMLYNVDQNDPISGAIWFGIGNTVGIPNVDAVFSAVWAVRHNPIGCEPMVRTRREGEK